MKNLTELKKAFVLTTVKYIADFTNFVIHKSISISNMYYKYVVYWFLYYLFFVINKVHDLVDNYHFQHKEDSLLYNLKVIKVHSRDDLGEMTSIVIEYDSKHKVSKSPFSENMIRVFKILPFVLSVCVLCSVCIILYKLLFT